MRHAVIDFLNPLGVALLFWGMIRLYALTIRQGRPLTGFMKGSLLYAPISVLGLGYLMLFAGNLHWSTRLLFSLIAAWGALVGLVAWWRRKKAT
jgi:hypothetical protein